MPGLESDVVPLSPDPVAPPMRPFFHPWATWLSTALVVLLVGYAFVLSPGDPLDHLRWPEDSLERLAGRDMEMRGAMARAPRWERQLYAIVSGGDEGVEEWEPDNEAATRRREWITAAYLEPSLPRATGRALITEARDELPAGWFVDALVARLALRSGDAVAREQAGSATLTRGAAILNRWRGLQAVGVLLAVAGLASVAVMALTHADLRIADARMLGNLSLSDGYGLFIRGALGFLALGTGLGLIIPDQSALDGITGPATIAPILLCAFWYVRANGQSFTDAFGLAPARGRWATIGWVAVALVK